MHWGKYYNKLSLPYALLFISILIKKREVIVFFFFPFIIYFVSSGGTLNSWSKGLLFLFISFSYYFILFSKVYLANNIDIYLNKQSFNISLNQHELHKTHRMYKNYKIFFLTSKNHNCSKEVEEKIAYIEAQKRHHLNLMKNQNQIFIYYQIITVFLLSFIVLWSLFYFFDSLSRPIQYPNIVFLFSTIFIIQILEIGYRTFQLNTALQYYSKLKNKIYKNENCSKIDFIINNTPIRKEKEDMYSTDISGIVVGVLFSLYVTLVFNKIYPVQTETQLIIDKNVTAYIKEAIK